MPSISFGMAARQALQAALAVGASIYVGTLISGQRWYWAVIAAFIVGIGVGSRGEAIVKALQRVFGTLFGILVGIGLATGVAGHTNLALGLTLVWVFCAFYAFQAAYGIMSFFITLMVAMLYGLLGQFKPEMLVLRLEETAAGAGIALVVIMLVLPIRQRTTFRDAATDALDAVARVLRETTGDDPVALREALGALRTKTQALRNAVGSLKRGWISLTPMHYRRSTRAILGCAYIAREIANAGGLGRDRTQVVLTRLWRVRHRITGSDDKGPFQPARLGGALSDAPPDRLMAEMLDAIDHLSERLEASVGRG